jgi:hypothetical protein
VRQTADGQLVLSHDDHLTDAQRRVHLVGQSILTELRAIDLGQGERIPTLTQAIELCKQERMGQILFTPAGNDSRIPVHCSHRTGLRACDRPSWASSAGTKSGRMRSLRCAAWVWTAFVVMRPSYCFGRVHENHRRQNPWVAANGHSERSEESLCHKAETLHCVQGDKSNQPDLATPKRILGFLCAFA